MSVRWPSHGSSSATRRSFGHSTPSEPSRPTSPPASARKRLAETRTGTRSGIGASSATRTKRSSTMRPFSTSGINAIPEWLNARAFDRVDEQFIRPLAQFEIGLCDIFDNIGNLRIRHGRANQRTKLRIGVCLSAQCDLIKLLAVLLNAKNADVADVVMAASVDAAGNVD